MKPVLVIFSILLTFLYIMFSDPKPHNWEKLGRYSLLFKSSLKSDNYSPEEVSQTFKEAGISPCFLDSESKKI